MKKCYVKMRLIILSLLMLAMANSSFVTKSSQALSTTLNNNGNSPVNKIYSSDLTATDALGRTLYSYSDVGDMKEDRYVGINFYLTTDGTGSQSAKPMDPYEANNTAVIEKYGVNAKALNYGDAIHYWAEPEIGFYNQREPWALEHQLRLLANAGIDFIYIDGSNGIVYEEAFKNLLDCIVKLKSQGIPTVRVVYWTALNKEELNKLLKYYQDPKYKDVWFYWENKPAMMYRSDVRTNSYALKNIEPYKSMFTWRFAWVPSDSDNANKHYNTWNDSPETVGESTGFYSFSDRYKNECMSVGTSGFAENDKGRGPRLDSGRSAVYGKTSGYDLFGLRANTDKGTYFQDRWNDIFKMQNTEVGLPKIVLICRWNEWTAGQFSEQSDMLPSFIEQFNKEFSRDIEPMKGGFTDNYYYQMCNNIRKFKGLPQPQKVSAAKSIDINGQFSQWNNVTPVFTDFVGDTDKRDALGSDNTIRYTNTTGRNDIVLSKTTFDAGNIYFYAKTNANLTSPTSSKNWMLLYVDSDNNYNTGWNGYDYLINKHIIDGGKTTISKWVDNIWKEVGSATYKCNGNELQVCVPRSIIGMAKNDLSYNYHWHDNPKRLYDINEFFVSGDSAPDRRFNYPVKANCVYNVASEKKVQGRADKSIYMDAVRGNFSRGINAGGYTLFADNVSTVYPKLPDFDLIQASSSKVLQSLDLNKVEVYGRSKNFGAVFDGYIKVDGSGNYNFHLASDDGSKLYIDNRVIIDNSVAVVKTEKTSSIGLDAGFHRIRIDYYCGKGDKYLSCSFSSGSMAKTAVDNYLYVGTETDQENESRASSGNNSVTKNKASSISSSNILSNSISSGSDVSYASESVENSSNIEKQPVKKKTNTFLIVAVIASVLLLAGAAVLFLKKKGILFVK